MLGRPNHQATRRRIEGEPLLVTVRDRNDLAWLGGRRHRRHDPTIRADVETCHEAIAGHDYLTGTVRTELPDSDAPGVLDDAVDRAAVVPSRHGRKPAPERDDRSIQIRERIHHGAFRPDLPKTREAWIVNLGISNEMQVASR